MLKVIMLTPEASKRLLARYIARLPEVQKAFQNGFIMLSLGTTCGYIIEELSGESIPLSRYACGRIATRGPCLLGPAEQSQLVVFDHGQKIQLTAKENSLDFSKSMKEYLDKMGPDDIFIKSGNIIDPSGKVATLIGGPAGGEIGMAIPYIKKGVASIVPMLVSKTIPLHVDDILKILKEEKVTKEWCDAEPCSAVRLMGKVITEMEVIKQAFGVDAFPIGQNGIAGGKGSTIFMLRGPAHMTEATYQYLWALKDEPALEDVKNMECHGCPAYIGLREKQGRQLE